MRNFSGQLRVLPSFLHLEKIHLSQTETTRKHTNQIPINLIANKNLELAHSYPHGTSG